MVKHLSPTHKAHIAAGLRRYYSGHRAKFGFSGLSASSQANIMRGANKRRDQKTSAASNFLRPGIDRSMAGPGAQRGLDRAWAEAGAADRHASKLWYASHVGIANAESNSSSESTRRRAAAEKKYSRNPVPTPDHALMVGKPHVAKARPAGTHASSALPTVSKPKTWAEKYPRQTGRQDWVLAAGRRMSEASLGIGASAPKKKAASTSGGTKKVLSPAQKAAKAARAKARRAKKKG